MSQVEVPNRRERKKAATRARIIEEATTLFQRNGYQATTIEDITDAADVAPRTFYSYFDAKVRCRPSVSSRSGRSAMWRRWRPVRPERRRSRWPKVRSRSCSARDTSPRSGCAMPTGGPIPRSRVAVRLSETEPEVAGRVYQVMVAFQSRLTELFRERLGYPLGAIEPRVIAASVTATWFVAIYGFADVCAGDDDPPSIDELGLTGMRAFAEGLGALWEGRLGD